MINDALHTIINPITPAYPIIGEFDAAAPFCTFTAEPSPIRIKGGIIGFVQKVIVYLIDDNFDRLQTNTAAIQSAVEAMTGTIDGTIITDVQFTGESGIQFDKQTATYQNSLEFTFDTDNR